MSSHSNPLAPVVDLWLQKIRLALEYKREVFQDCADEIMRFYSEPHDFMYEGAYGTKSKSFLVGDDETEVPPPTFRMTANKVAEFVQLFGPLLYHRNPNRRVRPRSLPSPPPQLFGLTPDGFRPTGDPVQDQNMMAMLAQYQMATKNVAEQRVRDAYAATLMEAYLNYTPSELDLKGEMAKAIDEALIKGRGLLWTEVFARPFGAQQKMIGSFFGSVDDLIIDPDAESLRDALWIARRCRKSVGDVEEKYGWPEGSLKANRESLNRQAIVDSDPSGPDARRRGTSCDQIVYYEIWSRVGAGSRLREDSTANAFMVDRLKPFLDQFGRFVYLVVADGVHQPLNVPPQLLDAEGGMDSPEVANVLRQNLQWPIPFFADSQNPWPFTEIDFHCIPRRAWPMAHMKPAMGYQKFLNWIYSLMANKIRITCRDILLMAAGASDEAKAAIRNGGDLTIVELQNRNPGEFEKIVEVLKMTPMNADAWSVTAKIEKLFEQATGMTEIFYGMQTGPAMRSAQEAALKGDMTRIRPDAMMSAVEDAASLMARKEAMAARWILDPVTDVAPVLGEDGAMIWSILLFNQDVFYVVRELEYRIEAGSSRKPNRDLDLANSNDAAQFLFPVLMQTFTATGDAGPVNAFLKYWAKARDLDVSEFSIPNLPPPQPQGSKPSETAQDAPVTMVAP